MKRVFTAVLCLLLLAPESEAADPIRIVTTTSTLAGLAHEITGDLADIHYVASPRRNFHFVSPTPKDVLMIRKADVFIHLGLDAEPWRYPLLDAAGNAAFLAGGRAAIDVSTGIKLMEAPSTVSRSEGDIHVYGNPHYWNDPENAATIVKNIERGLSGLFPDRTDMFHKNADAFIARLRKKTDEWTARMEPFSGTAALGYHRSWPYFARRFGLRMVGEIEPKPGIPPTSKHLARLAHIIRAENVKIIIKETYFEGRTPAKVAGESGIRVVELAQNISEIKKDAFDYVSMIERNVSVLEAALREAGDE